jgi:hypothetical protein
MADYASSEVISGLRTTAVPYIAAGPCLIAGKLTLPRASQGSAGASTVVVTVNQNGSPIYVGAPGADGFKTIANIVLGDVINIVTSSSNPIDQALNAVKMTVSIFEGGD